MPAAIILNAEERQTIIDLYLGGLSFAQVAEVMDWLYQDATIFLQRKHQIYLRMKEYLAGIDAKLSAQYAARDILNQQIIELRQTGMTAASIAERLEINEGRVWRGIYAFNPPPLRH
jgi:DNA-binding transcriptional MerR regulator